MDHVFPYTLCLSGHFLGLTAVARARHGSEVQQTFRDSKLCGFVELEDAGPESQLCIQSSLQNGTSEYYSLADAHCCRRNRDSGPCALFGTAWPITCMLLVSFRRLLLSPTSSASISLAFLLFLNQVQTAVAASL